MAGQTNRRAPGVLGQFDSAPRSQEGVAVGAQARNNVGQAMPRFVEHLLTVISLVVVALPPFLLFERRIPIVPIVIYFGTLHWLLFGHPPARTVRKPYLWGAAATIVALFAWSRGWIGGK